MIMKARVDGGFVSVGDSVCFKSGYEQCGRVVKIKRSNFGGGFDLVIENRSGDLILRPASECWLE
jgi:hypothetical protein